MRKFLCFFCITCLLLSIQLPIYAAESISVDALAAILMDYKTGRVLWEKNAHEPMANASTTKIMTGLLTLEKGNLNDTVVISKRAAAAPEVNMNLQTGEEIKLEYLLYALMLQSSNDAAIAIAEHIGGTVEDFCDMMTQRAKELGALDSVFRTPNGLDLEDHHSTAYDLAVITRYALANPEFVKVINTSSITASSSKNTHTITNKNRLLSEFPGANGVKTGFTGKAGHCFVGSAVQDDMQLISVVLASGWGNKGKEQKWVDTKTLLKYGFENYKYETIIEPNANAGQLVINRSKTPTVSYSFSEGFQLPLTASERENIEISLSAPTEIMAPVVKGDEIGKATVSLDGVPLCEISLLADATAERHDLKTSLEKVLGAWLSLGDMTDVKVTLPEF